MARFEKFLEALAEKELDRFEDIYSDAKWIEGKTAKKVGGSKSKVVSDTPGPAHVEELLGVDSVDQGRDKHFPKKAQFYSMIYPLFSSKTFSNKIFSCKTFSRILKFFGIHGCCRSCLLSG